jgi:putative ABC transport system permease protein
MFVHHVKIAIRNLWKHRGYSFINIAGLALGMAFAVLILLWVRFEVEFDRFHDNEDRLYLVAFKGRDNEFFGDFTVGETARHLKAEYPEVTHATRVSTTLFRTFRLEDRKYRARGYLVDPDFLEMFTFPVVRGSLEMALAEPHSVAITERFANRVFGDDDPLGKSLRYEDRLDLTVTAVLADAPANTKFRMEFLIPAVNGPPVYRRWDVKCLQTFVMLAEGADPDEVSRKIRDIYNVRVSQDTKNDYYLVPMSRIHLHDLAGGGPIAYVMIFTGIAVAILLMACINFVNLATARAEIRFKEIGVKKALGARRGQLAVQFLRESVLLSLIALVLAVGMVEWMAPMLNAVLQLRLRLDFSAESVLALLGIALFTGAVAGIYPAFYLSSLKPLAVLRGRDADWAPSRWRSFGGISGGTRGAALRRLLVLFQLTLSVAFIVCVSVIFGQVKHLSEMDVGFDPDDVVFFYLPSELTSKTAAVKRELRRLPGVESVTVSANSLTRWSASFGIDWDGRPEGLAFDVGYNEVDHDFVETLRMEMVRGRFFSREHATDASDAFVVNEALVRAAGIEDAVGLEFVAAEGSPMERRGTIVGVVRDYHTESARREIRPFMLGLTENGNIMCVRISPGQTGETLGKIRSTLRSIQEDADPGFWFYEHAIARVYAAEIVTGTVIVFITVVAVSISCLGLLGLAAFMARRRTKEIGIRKVLGASVGSIAALFLRETMVLVAAACVLGSTIAYLIMKVWLEGFAFRMNFGIWPFALATLITVLLAGATVGGQAARAAGANPSDAIRYE